MQCFFSITYIFYMKPSLLSLIVTFAMPSVFAGGPEWWIDFGRSEFAWTYGVASKYATRTTVAGWNNVSVAEQTNRGAATLSSSYFAETVAKDSASVTATYQARNLTSVAIYDSRNAADSVLSLSINKDTAIGTFDTIQSANAPADKLFTSTARPDWVPTNAYGDYIYSYLNRGGSGAFTLTLSGFKAGEYHITVIAGGNSYMGSVYEGNDASACYTLNGVGRRTILGTNAAGGGYAGVLEWKGVEVAEDGLLQLTVEGGYLGYDGDVEKYTTAAINAMMITMVPEPTTGTLSLLALCGFAVHR